MKLLNKIQKYYCGNLTIVEKVEGFFEGFGDSLGKKSV